MSTIRSVLYTSKVLKNKKHPVLIQVHKDKIKSTLSTGYYAAKDQWNFNQDLPRKNHPNYKELKAFITEKINQAEKIILNFDLEEKDYSAKDIINKLKNNNAPIDLKHYTESIIPTLSKGNQQIYRTK